MKNLGTPAYKKKLMARGNPWDSLALIKLDKEVE